VIQMQMRQQEQNLFAEIQKKISALTETQKNLSRENQILRQYISENQIQAEKFNTELQHKLADNYAAAREADYYYNIDIVGTCSVQCPSCPVGNSADAPTPKGMMSIETFEEVLDKIKIESPGARTSVELYNWGESALHPDLPKFIAAVKNRGFICGLSNNLNHVRDMRGLVKAKPDYLRVSISGFKNETYQQTHRGGDVNNVKANLHLLRATMDSYGLDVTQVEIGYLVYRHNFDEDFIAIKHLCDQLHFSFNWTFSVMMPVETAIKIAEGKIPKNVEEINDLLVINPAKWKELTLQYRDYFKECDMRPNRTVINFDKSVPLCCGTYLPENYIAQDFLKISHNDLQKKKYENDLCAKCMENMVDHMFTCVRPPEVDDYAYKELSKLGTFTGKNGR